MSGLYGFASRLSGCMAGLCAVLALLALPSPSQADTYSDCMTICSVYTNQDFSECMGNCMSGAGPSPTVNGDGGAARSASLRPS